MDDEAIIELYWQRSEAAIEHTKTKYGAYCHTIAYNILSSSEDSDECVNDTYLRLWNSIPPARPRVFSAFIGKTARNLALDRLRSRRAARRGGGEASVAIDELSECLPSGDELSSRADSQEIIEALNSFLAALDAREREVFMRRYWLSEPVGTLCKKCELTPAGAASMLHRLRGRLRAHLEEEGVTL